ncbi:hypothetical protein [Streptomyces antimycoticus]|uniref:hypothetical protein n=1 Tax=Streptomyces antimycoticus TaxID=68175 RepID=UPI0025703034|nr:hypothetical protein [Streptomyces antimycoticus]WJD99767.1 hypothetical protein QR300_29380 [Streptomyces antimycoticus]
MRDGDKLRLIGPAGAPFVVTVGPSFTAEYIEERLRTGEWRQPEDAPAAAPAQDQGDSGPGDGGDGAGPPDPRRPSVNDPKSVWIRYIVSLGHLSAEDAANYTKADLIEMAN